MILQTLTVCECCVFFVITSFPSITWHYRFMSLLHIEFTYVLARLCWSQCSFLEDFYGCPQKSLGGRGMIILQGNKPSHRPSVVTFRKVDFVFTPLSIYLSKHEHLGFRKGWDLSLLKKPTGYRRVVCLGWKVSISVGGKCQESSHWDGFERCHDLETLRCASWALKMIGVLGMGGLWGCNKKKAWTEKTCVSAWLYSIVNLIFFLRIRSCLGQLKSIWPR